MLLPAFRNCSKGSVYCGSFFVICMKATGDNSCKQGKTPEILQELPLNSAEPPAPKSAKCSREA